MIKAPQVVTELLPVLAAILPPTSRMEVMEALPAVAIQATRKQPSCPRPPQFDMVYKWFYVSYLLSPTACGCSTKPSVMCVISFFVQDGGGESLRMRVYSRQSVTIHVCVSGLKTLQNCSKLIRTFLFPGPPPLFFPLVCIPCAWMPKRRSKVH